VRPLRFEHPRGILDHSLLSDGLQKSDGNREREAEKAVSGVEAWSEVLNPSDAHRSDASPERCYKRQNQRQHGGSQDRENGASAFRPPMNGGGNCTQNKKLSESDEVGEFGLGSVWTRTCRSRNTVSRPTGMRHSYHLLRTRLGFAICHVVEETILICEHSFSVDGLPVSGMSAVSSPG
jgi:hypothetical protein